MLFLLTECRSWLIGIDGLLASLQYQHLLEPNITLALVFCHDAERIVFSIESNDILVFCVKAAIDVEASAKNDASLFISDAAASVFLHGRSELLFAIKVLESTGAGLIGRIVKYDKVLLSLCISLVNFVEVALQ